MPRRLKLRSLAFRVLFVVAGLCLVAARQARGDATDVSVLFVTKTQLFLQNGPAQGVPRPNPFAFEAGATPSRPNTIVSGTFTAPSAVARTFTNLGGGNLFFDGGTFASMAALNAVFLSGNYNFNLQTTTAPTAYADFVTLTGDTYPTNVPRILSGTWSGGALQVDSTKNYAMSWNDIAPTTSPNRMLLEIIAVNGATVFSQFFAPDPSGFNINFTLPANTLQPGSYYTAKLTFERRTVVVGGPVSKVATYANETAFKIATINAVPTVTGPSAPLATIGEMFVYQIIANNHPFSYGVSALPPGLTLNSTLGIISGIPTAQGTTPATLSATNIDGVGTKSNFAITVQPFPKPGPGIVSSTSAHAFSGQPFKFQVVTEGGTSAARISATGLPAGLTLDPVTGKITGTTNAVGSFSVSLTVTDGAASSSGFLQLTFTADAAYPIITNADTALLPKNQPFNYQIVTPGANDPDDPVTYTMIGTLPQGLGFNAATGTISGSYTGPVAPPGADKIGLLPNAPDLSGGALLGSIQLFGTNSHGTSTFQLLFLAQPTGAVNISTRLFVGTGNNVLIAGFIITGNVPKVVIIRGMGPSLGIPGSLQDPVLELHNSSGGVVTNDNWKDTQEQIIRDTTIPPTDDRESAIVIALDPGNYSAILSGKNGLTGIGLVEVYDLGTASLDSTSKAQLAQISTRGNVLQGDNVMIGGFIVSGATTNVIVRAIGPSLQNFGITNPLLDPTLELFNGNGTSLAMNDDWRTTQEQAIKNTGVPPTDDRESAIVASLAPSAYTAIVRGKGTATGVALVEVYGLP
jgi:hypothetical protein